MRFTIIKIIVCNFLFANIAFSFDTSNEEKTCVDIGFKLKTESFGNCVLELLERNSSSNTQSKQAPITSPDDATCRQYGFKLSSSEYASCRLQIDQARQDAQRQQANFQQQQRQYETQLKAQRDQQDRAAWFEIYKEGRGMMSGGNLNYPAPIPPVAPQNNRWYNLPGGKSLYCTTSGTVTNCF